MAKNGYDQFFKNARKQAAHPNLDTRKMAQELRQRVREQRPSKKATRRGGIPWKLAGLSMLGLLICGAGLLHADQIESFVKRIEINVMGKAFANESAPEAAAKPAEAPTDKKAEATQAPVAKDFSPEEINHFSKLNERKRELDAREEELTRLESELAVQKEELEKKIKSLDQSRREISSLLEERVQTDDKKVENLVQVYSTMKPQQAAKIFEEMDRDLAVQILGRMKKKNAAEIMNLIKPEKAKSLSEMYAGYRREST